MKKQQKKGSIKYKSMTMKKTTFALFLGNRGTFPASLLKEAREEMCSSLNKLGHEVLIPPADTSESGAFEIPAEDAELIKE